MSEKNHHNLIEAAMFKDSGLASKGEKAGQTDFNHAQTEFTEAGRQFWYRHRAARQELCYWLRVDEETFYTTHVGQHPEALEECILYTLTKIPKYAEDATTILQNFKASEAIGTLPGDAADRMSYYKIDEIAKKNNPRKLSQPVLWQQIKAIETICRKPMSRAFLLHGEPLTPKILEDIEFSKSTQSFLQMHPDLTLEGITERNPSQLLRLGMLPAVVKNIETMLAAYGLSLQPDTPEVKPRRSGEYEHHPDPHHGKPGGLRAALARGKSRR